MSNTDTTTDKKPAANPIPPKDRIAVDATTAAALMSCSRSTFFQRVKDGVYPRAWDDGLWRVNELLLCGRGPANRTTTASA